MFIEMDGEREVRCGNWHRSFVEIPTCLGLWIAYDVGVTFDGGALMSNHRPPGAFAPVMVGEGPRI